MCNEIVVLVKRSNGTEDRCRIVGATGLDQHFAKAAADRSDERAVAFLFSRVECVAQDGLPSREVSAVEQVESLLKLKIAARHNQHSLAQSPDIIPASRATRLCKYRFTLALDRKVIHINSTKTVSLFNF